MPDKRVLLLGFVVGILIGGALLIGTSWSANLTPNDIKAEYAATKPERMKSEDEKAAYKEGLSLFSNGEYQRSLQVIGRQALDGYANAQFAIGAMYQEGKGLPKDEQQAVQWFKIAAEQGYSLALQHMGWAYGTGSGVESDPVESRRWFLRAAAAGDGTSQFMAGDMLLKGIGGPVDRQLGIHWLTKAAGNGVQLARAQLDQIMPQVEFESMVADVAREQGGEISLNQMAALADIYSRLNGGPPAYSGPQGRGYQSGGTHTNYGPGGATSNLGGMSGQSAYGGARRSVDEEYGTAPAASRYVGRRTPSVDVGSPIILNPAGPGLYSDSNGDIYTRSGPNGVVNTRTGEFSPANR